MAHPITEISAFNYNNLSKELEIPKEQKPFFTELLKAYENDFWQEGNGTLLPPPKGPEASTLNKLFEKRFVFRNVIKECMSRASGAFYSKSPNWRFSTADAQSRADEPEESEDKVDPVEQALTDYWTRENLSAVLSKAFESRLVSGRGGIRIYVPKRYQNTAPVPEPEEGTEDTPEGTEAAAPGATPAATIQQFDSIEEALKAIKVEYIPPDRSILLDEGGELFSLVKYVTRDNWEKTDTVNMIEFSFVDDSNISWVGVVKENENLGTIKEAKLSSPLDLGGLTLFNEFKGEPYATMGLYKNNQLLNLALTCSGFSIVDNGFSEVFFMNVDVEMEEIADPSAEGGTRMVPKNIKRGGGTVQNLIGIAQEDPESGAETRQTPGVTFREPSTLQAFKDGKELAYMSCLEEMSQLFAKITGDAAVSGESRIQALTDFWLRIRKYKPEVDDKGSWVLTAILRLAALMSGQAEKHKNTLVVYDSRVFLGPVSDSEREAIIRQKNEGIISRETARVLLGVDDPGLEEKLVILERKQNPQEVPLSEFSAKLDVALKMSETFDKNYILNYLGIEDEAERKQILDALAADVGPVNFGDFEIDPATGLPIDPVTGLPIDPSTGLPIEPTVPDLTSI